MNREREKKYYISSKTAADLLDKTFKMLDFTPEQRRHFSERPFDYRYGDVKGNLVPEFSTRTSHDCAGGLYTSLYAMLNEVQKGRGYRSIVREDNVFSKAKQISEVNAASIINVQFPKLKVDTICAKKNVSEYIKRSDSRYHVCYDITIPITWARGVLDKGISVVHDGKRPHVVLKAKERKLDRLKDEGITAYSCTSMTGNNGQPNIHYGWVMQWSNGEASITAFNSDFTKAESLLRRRIKKAVTDVLLDF